MPNSRTTRPIAWVLFGAAMTLAGVVAVERAWPATAAPGDLDTTFVPVTPCRLFDYRPGPANVGDRTTPLEPGEAHTQQVTGGVGDCDGAASIPSTATGVAMNVTIAQPTAQSNLRLYPADAPSPLASNLNWLAGQSPTPNKVDVKLSPGGAVNIENFQGTVFVIGDVVGYYTNSSLVELEQRLSVIENSRSFAVSTQQGAFSSTSRGFPAQLTVTAPVDGHVTVNSYAIVIPSGPAVVTCGITDGTAVDSGFEQGAVVETGQGLDVDDISGTRRFPIDGGATVTYRLVCKSPSLNNAQLTDISMTAIFTPAP